MNYRQWKKNYKKKNGYNPSLMEDKRKQVKVMGRLLRKCCNADIEDLRNRIIDGLSKAYMIIGDFFCNMADIIKIE